VYKVQYLRVCGACLFSFQLEDKFEFEYYYSSRIMSVEEDNSISSMKSTDDESEKVEKVKTEEPVLPMGKIKMRDFNY